MSYGSIEFSGLGNSYLQRTLNIDFNIGTSEFTIEWFQYHINTQNNSWPRIFSLGSYPSATIAVSIEGGNFYLWLNNSFRMSFSVLGFNQWVHYSINRDSSNNIRVFEDGVLKGTISFSSSISISSGTLYIGIETPGTKNSAFEGYLTNFHWLVGATKYTSATDESEIYNRIEPQAGTSLLLLANENDVYDDAGTNDNDVTNNNTSFNEETPFPDVPCLTDSCNILTKYGYMNIKDLKVGDYVLTNDKRNIKITKITQTKLQSKLKKPVLIPAHYYGEYKPLNNTYISKNHAILINNRWYYAGDLNFKQEYDKKEIVYYHIKLNNYYRDNLVVNGIIMESWDGYDAVENREYIWRKKNDNSIYRLKKIEKI